MNIRKGIKADLAAVLSLIQELADYENALKEVEVDLAQFEGYYAEGLFDLLVAEEEGEILGAAVFYFGYSTWKGKMLYLDDLIVTRSQRRQGTGSQLFHHLILHAKTEQANQIRWHVLDWNVPAIEFYKKIEASLDAGWITCKLEKDQIQLYK